jgi:prepilin-type N-terminal cleavage/methylation domain-containing protein
MSTLLLSSASPTRAGRPCHAVARPGFTLIELLVVIGIIVILIAILIPAAAAVRKRAYATSTSQEISTIASACQAYYGDYHSYPGPIAENDIDLQTGTITLGPSGLPLTPSGMLITSSENLVLGLTGGLNLTFTGTPAAATAFNYTPSIITQAQGPQSLNTLINSQKQTSAYFSPKPEELAPPNTTGNYPAFGSADSEIPEYLDHIPGNVVNSTNSNVTYGPILYMRARVGASGPTAGVPGLVNEPGATGYVNPGSSAIGFQYNFNQLAPYGFTVVPYPNAPGAPGDANDFPLPSPNPPTGSAYAQMYDAITVYFANSAIAWTPKSKDSFILISAGSDRMFGTKDDIIYGN